MLKNCKEFIYLPITYNGASFINTQTSGANLSIADEYIDEPIEWLDADNNSIVLTKLQVRELIALMITHRSTGYFKEAALIKLIEDASCDTVVKVNNINIDFS